MSYKVLSLLSLVTIGASGLLILTGLILMYPPKPYEGPYKALYLFILVSHSILAAINLPLAVVTVYMGLRDKLSKHRKIAPITAFVWIYVAVTGWMIFAFLKLGGG